LPDTTKGWLEALGCDAQAAGGDGTDVNLIIYPCGTSPLARVCAVFRGLRL